MQDIESLVRRAQNDEQAFREIYDYTIDRVFSYVLLRTGDRENTKEIVQEIYLSFWKSLPKFRFVSKDHFYGFLWQVVRRRIIRSRKGDVKTVPLEDVYDIPTDDMPREDHRHLLKCVSSLSEKEARVVELRYFEHLSFDEVGSMLGISENNAKVLHHRALAHLRKKLQSHG